MFAVLVAMSLILAVAAATAGMVVVGMQGRGRDRAPRLADRMATAAEHLNGDAEPPAAFIRILNAERADLGSLHLSKSRPTTAP